MLKANLQIISTVVVVVDVAEHNVERPKKNKGVTIQERKSGTSSRAR